MISRFSQNTINIGADTTFLTSFSITYNVPKDFTVTRIQSFVWIRRNSNKALLNGIQTIRFSNFSGQSIKPVNLPGQTSVASQNTYEFSNSLGMIYDTYDCLNLYFSSSGVILIDVTSYGNFDGLTSGAIDYSAYLTLFWI